MYKSRLQELCMQRRWAPPEYTHRRAGPDHAPLFGATVAVNGAEFSTGDAAARSAKEAHNIAAKAAFDHLSSLPMPPPPPSLQASENQTSYKSQLQTYAQKKTKALPSYQTIREGPVHASRFKSVVTVDGKAFESPEYYHTIKDAESAAAKLALMSLPQEVSSTEQVQVQPLSYKNLLQEVAQKHGISLPAYNTASDGSMQVPIFKSTVVFQGESFEGEPGNTKKQAEMNAAKVAFQHFENRRKNFLSSTVLAGPHLEQGTVNLSAGQQVKIAQPAFSVPQASAATRHSESGANSTKCPDEHIQPCELKEEKPAFPEPSTVAEVMDSSPELTQLEDGHSAPFTPIRTASSTGCGCSLLTNRVQVYPRRPDLVLPEGATVLPFSDDVWVAVSLPTLNH
ncbi:double-stranded RNA-binding protein 1-like isoform X2 [Oryza brachyantha]|uniref:double-stranded RNA-binding protein 1-like isoform X2 n=1 Tax=Oryza brachyantha TaxID=4533 RepID=UPI000776013F|nr:double-stranded RNA-binding protein 1-like isoform X2 [Oryza brachyantha]